MPESPLACSVLIPLAAGEAERGALVPKKAERSCFDKECGWRNEAGPVDNRVLSEIMLCKGEGERGGVKNSMRRKGREKIFTSVNE